MSDTGSTTDGASSTVLEESVAPSHGDALRDLALEALGGVAPDGTVGDLLGVAGDGEVREVTFASMLPGYRAWRWTVEVSVLPALDPSVLEVALLPGDDALVAPPWVPWADRLADYRRLHPDDVPEDLSDGDDEDSDDDASDDAVDDDLDEDLEIADPDDFDLTDADEGDLALDDEPDSGVPEPDDTANEGPRA